MSDAPLAARLAELEAEVSQANDRASAARANISGEAFYAAAREVVAPLLAYKDDIQLRRPGVVPLEDRPARERELTDELVRAVQERGLVFTATGNGSLGILDPALDREHEEANGALAAAKSALNSFKREHADDLDAERRSADAELIREALDSDDGDRIRDALGVG